MEFTLPWKKKGTKWKTTDIREINLDKEQTVLIKVGDIVMHIYKDYPDVKGAIKRQYEKRKAKGMCVAFGCPDKAEPGRLKCKMHADIEREKSKLRMREKRKKELNKIEV